MVRLNHPVGGLVVVVNQKVLVVNDLLHLDLVNRLTSMVKLNLLRIKPVLVLLNLLLENLNPPNPLVLLDPPKKRMVRVRLQAVTPI